MGNQSDQWSHFVLIIDICSIRHQNVDDVGVALVDSCYQWSITKVVLHDVK